MCRSSPVDNETRPVSTPACLLGALMSALGLATAGNCLKHEHVVKATAPHDAQQHARPRARARPPARHRCRAASAGPCTRPPCRRGQRRRSPPASCKQRRIVNIMRCMHSCTDVAAGHCRVQMPRSTAYLKCFCPASEQALLPLAGEPLSRLALLSNSQPSLQALTGARGLTGIFALKPSSFMSHAHGELQGAAPDDRELPLQVLHVLGVPAASAVLRLLGDAQADPPHLPPPPWSTLAATTNLIRVG